MTIRNSFDLSDFDTAGIELPDSLATPERLFARFDREQSRSFWIEQQSRALNLAAACRLRSSALRQLGFNASASAAADAGREFERYAHACGYRASAAPTTGSPIQI